MRKRNPQKNNHNGVAAKQGLSSELFFKDSLKYFLHDFQFVKLSLCEIAYNNMEGSLLPQGSLLRLLHSF
jgi:hypothetical protein